LAAGLRSAVIRRAVKLLAKAIGWTDAGAPFALMAPVLVTTRRPWRRLQAWRSIHRSSKHASVFVWLS
jgi:hypothetical protein